MAEFFLCLFVAMAVLIWIGIVVTFGMLLIKYFVWLDGKIFPLKDEE